MKGANLWV